MAGALTTQKSDCEVTLMSLTTVMILLRLSNYDVSLKHRTVFILFYCLMKDPKVIPCPRGLMWPLQERSKLG